MKNIICPITNLKKLLSREQRRLTIVVNKKDEAWKSDFVKDFEIVDDTADFKSRMSYFTEPYLLYSNTTYRTYFEQEIFLVL